MKNILLKTAIASVGILMCFGAYALANPAAVNCAKKGLKYVNLQSPKGWYGFCIFTNKKKGDSYCNEWAFFRGQCKKGQLMWPGKTVDYKHLNKYCIKKTKKGARVVFCKHKPKPKSAKHSTAFAW